VAGFVLLSFVLGVFIQSEVPVSMNGILIKLSGESAFMLMSLLGATLVPHNFYLHSSIVQVFFPLILDFRSCKCTEMSVSMASLQENIFYLCVGLFASHLLLVCKDETSDCCINYQICMGDCLTAGVFFIFNEYFDQIDKD
jgi:Mn2+/Fe2+ NRAMP family transporter